MALTPFEHLAHFPGELLSGFGIGRLVISSEVVRDALLNESVLQAIRWFTFAGCVVSILSHRLAVIVTPLVFVNVVVLDSLMKALGGFANHAQLVPLIALGVFAGSSRVRYLSLPQMLSRDHSDPSSVGRTCAAVVWVTGLIVVLPYTYIGWQRLISGGLDLFLGEALLRYFAAATRSFEALPEWLDPRAVQGWLRAGFFVTTILEATASLALLSRTYRRVWLISMVVFHVSTLVWMNILFWENLVIACAIFWWGWDSGPSDGG